MARKQNVHPLIKLAGKMLTFWQIFVKTLVDLGATEDDFDKIDNHEIIRELAKAFLGTKAALKQGLRVAIDRTKKVSQLVTDGQYGWRSDEINDANIKLNHAGPEEIWVEYVHLGKEATDAEVDAEHERLGLIPLEPEYMLAFGVQHPDEQRKHPVCSMYTAWVDSDRHQRLLYLDTGGNGRDLGLRYRDTGARWGAYTRFAARRKPPVV
jgi:hypothetical protein